MESASQVQIIVETVCNQSWRRKTINVNQLDCLKKTWISPSTNNFWKGIHPTILPPVMGN